MKFNGIMIVHSKIVGVTYDINFNHVQPFNELMTKRIEEKTAVAASDAAAKMEKWEVFRQCLMKMMK